MFRFTGFRLLLGVLLAVSFHAGAADLYVSPGGNDAWNGRVPENIPGTSEGPFATLAAARDLARSFLQHTGILEPITIHVAPGDYLLTEPFALGEQDQFSEQDHVSYLAEPGSKTRLIAGKLLTGFTPVNDAAERERLDPAARDHVVTVDLKAQGITDYGELKGGGLELFFNGVPMQISRWPNEGFVRIVELVTPEDVDIRGTKGSSKGRWRYEGDRPSRWLNEHDAWLFGYWFWDWSASYEKIKSIDTAQQQIEVEEPYHGYGYRKGQWYLALNLLPEIDRPGEWYLDRSAGKLYFWPPAALDGAEVFVSILKHAITLDNAAHVTFKGFTLEGARDTVARITGGTQNHIVACTIRNSGNGAISISESPESGAAGCDIYNVGGTGISLSGGDRATLTPGKLYAVNNHIHDYARWYRMYNPGISLQGVGNRAAHNLIDNAPHMAIQFGGNDHLMEFNEIHSVCYESNDAGAIYTGRDWTMRGTIIRNNYFHHITGFEGKGCVGVYLDDMHCGIEITHNLFHKVHYAAFIGGGRDNTYANNLFLDCPRALHIDNRAMNWAADHIPTTMTERLNAMPFRESPWKERYPQLLTILEDEPATPKGNVIARNLFASENWNDAWEGSRKYDTWENNLENLDPHFATPERITDTIATRATDFALKADSPAWALGFEALPLEQMGLVNDGTRASWPVTHEVRPVSKPIE
ncbi:MAG: right-handed parallel beta-helix repeat-containing protein [Candidatus Hydrogenedentes bacterium]|nr:right-handed parallel beta-helix repeat-containing protein [Candidatus Hydrogenedentota bacterium]